MLHLQLFGAAVADYRRFDGQWRILRYLQAGRGGSQHCDAANLTEFQRRLHIERVKDIFDRDFVGSMFRDDGAELRIYAGKSAGQRFTRRQLDGTAGEARELSAGENLNHPVSGIFSTAIDTENSHLHAVYQCHGESLSEFPKGQR